MKYDPKEFWERRPNPNAKGQDKAPDFMYDFIKLPFEGCTSIFELGPGVGRTLDVYKPGQQVTTVDL